MKYQNVSFKVYGFLQVYVILQKVKIDSILNTLLPKAGMHHICIILQRIFKKQKVISLHTYFLKTYLNQS